MGVASSRPRAKLVQRRGDASGRGSSCDRPVAREDVDRLRACLRKMIMFEQLDDDTLDKIMAEMTEWSVRRGAKIITQSDQGDATSRMFIVKLGSFEVFVKRNGATFKVGARGVGEFFGEIALVYACPRAATVVAAVDSVVWVLARDVFKRHAKDAMEHHINEIELFLSNINFFKHVPREDKRKLADAFVLERYKKGDVIVRQGDAGKKFYIIKDGDVSVHQANEPEEVNHLFKTEHFGELSLLKDEPRNATITASSEAVCLLSLDREVFIRLLGPFQDFLMSQPGALVEKSQKRMALLNPFGSVASQRPKACVVIKSKNKPDKVCTGHVDDVEELYRDTGITDFSRLVLLETAVLGEGAFSRVSKVIDIATRREFALKRILKRSVMKCYKHVKNESRISKNLTNNFCIRQHASFSDATSLYMLFDLMEGGDLMRALVASYTTVPATDFATPYDACCGCLTLEGAGQPRFIPKGMDEDVARYYVACVVLAFEYLHKEMLV